MSPGDVRTSKRGNGKTVVLAVGLWAKRHANGSIYIHMSGPGGAITTVTDDPKSKLRCHPNLFMKLRDTLADQGCWPFGDEKHPIEGLVGESHPASEMSSQPRFEPIRLRGVGPTASEIILHDRERF